MNKLDGYICSVPFEAIEMHESKRFLCCASWLTEYLPNHVPIKEAWESDTANKIRESVLDGSYTYCKSTACPFMNEIVHSGNPAPYSPIGKWDKLDLSTKSKIKHFRETGEIGSGPTQIQFSFDSSCNLKCPSCRVEMIMSSGARIKKSVKEIENIQNSYGKTVKSLYITGTGDPFVAVAFRDFLRNFDKSKWPSLKKIHLHTNATRWTPKMWESMSKIHKYVKSCEISIDAATRDTYENKTRLNGKWDDLIPNLKFIATIPELYSVKPSFVVQQSNYKEIPLFVELIESIFKGTNKQLRIYFGKITNWGTFTEEEFKQHDVFDKEHPEHEDFLQVMKNLKYNPNVLHNFNHILERKKVLI